MSQPLLNIELTGTLPKVNENLEPAMASIQDIMLQSVQMNIMMGGRPNPFAVKNPNETPLVGSGRMYAGIQGMHDGRSATVYMDPSVRSSKGFFYPAALNFGAEVPPVEGKLMVFEFEGKTIFTYSRKGFHLGPFAFMIFQEQDKTAILQVLSNAIFTTSEPIH
jgi:phage gpG-like protein